MLATYNNSIVQNYFKLSLTITNETGCFPSCIIFSWKKSRVFVLIICECSKNKLLKILIFNYLIIQYLQHNREVHQQNDFFSNKNELSFPIKKSFLILFLWIKLKQTFWLRHSYYLRGQIPVETRKLIVYNDRKKKSHL